MNNKQKDTLNDIIRHLKNLEKSGECSPNTPEQMEMITEMLNSIGIRYDTTEDWYNHYVLLTLRG